MRENTQTEIKPIETKFKGYRFRSRLEARWAVFFDRCCQHFLYENQGFKLNTGPYLPDFFFPKFRAFIEVKPLDQLPSRNFEFDVSGSWLPIHDIFPREINLALEMSRGMGLCDGHFVICYGDPWDVMFDLTSISINRNGPRVGIGFIDLFPASLSDAAQAARSARFEHGECV